MSNTQNRIAFLHGIHNNPHSILVVNLGQVLIILFHLFIDGPEVFRTALYIGLNTSLIQGLLQVLHGIVDDLFTGMTLLLHLIH